jgi:hypothetical protein
LPDYRDLLDQVEAEKGTEGTTADTKEESEYNYSLWTQSMVKNPKARVLEDEEETSSSTLATRNQQTQIISSASAQHYLKSTWQGLEQRIGETPVELAVLGLAGIPKQYESEPGQ